jgi:RNA polymerase sigma-70 factor, ECF subfamily
MTEPTRSPQEQEERHVEPPTFRSIFDSEFDFVYRTLRRFGIREADATDQAQEVFIVVHQLLPDYDASRPIRPWLVAIAYRVAGRYRTLARNVREVLDEEPAELADSAPIASSQLEEEERRALTLEALGQVELSRRAVFVLAEIEEQPIPEIAEALSIPLNTAYSRLRLAREDFEKAVRRIWARRTRQP